MFPFVLRLVLGNSPKTQGPNAALSLQETVPGMVKDTNHTGKTLEVQGLGARREIHRGLLHEKLAHTHKDTLSVGCGCTGATLAMMLSFKSARILGKPSQDPVLGVLKSEPGYETKKKGKRKL